ncbi:MAG: TlpA disulfide reductase family protein [Microthrixaceae bacterium]
MSKSDKPASPYPGANPGGGDKTKLYVIIGAVVAVVILAVVAVLLTSSGGGSKSNASKKGTGAFAAANAEREQAPIKVTGTPLASYPESQTVLVPPAQDPAVGQTPPKLEGVSFDGSNVTIDPADGRAKVIIFLAHWCPHCQNEVPRIQNWINEGKQPKDVDIYAVSTSVSSDRVNYPPSKWILREDFGPQVLLDGADSPAAKAFSLPGFPYFVALNADGTVAQRGSGEVPIEQFEQVVKALKL